MAKSFISTLPVTIKIVPAVDREGLNYFLIERDGVKKRCMARKDVLGRWRNYDSLRKGDVILEIPGEGSILNIEWTIKKIGAVKGGSSYDFGRRTTKASEAYTAISWNEIKKDI